MNNNINTTTIVRRKFIHVLVNISKKYSKFILYNEKSEPVTNEEEFLKSLEFCYTNDSSIKFCKGKKTISPLITFLQCEVSDNILLEKISSRGEYNIEIYFPNYQYPVRNNNLFDIYLLNKSNTSTSNNNSSGKISTFRIYIKNCLLHTIIPNKIIFNN